MLLGRVVWGVASMLVLGFAERVYLKAFMAGLLSMRCPVSSSLVLIPIAIIALDRARLTDDA